MNRFVFISTKILKRKYFMRLLGVCVPFIQFDAVLVFLLYIDTSLESNLSTQISIYKLLVLTTFVLLMIILLGLCIKRHLLKVHTTHTFVEFIGEYLVVSIHHETTFGFHPTYYKNLYVMKLSDLEKSSIKKGKITLKGNIRHFFDKADRLHYRYEDKKFKFDEWWYDYNCCDTLKSITIPNFFTSPTRLLRTIRSVSALEKARKERRLQYHEQMLRLAKSPHKTARVPRTILFKNEKR